MKNINCVFDGACEPRNPGGALGLGAGIFEEHSLVKNYSSFEPAHTNNTNNVAEYKAVIWVLETLVSLDLHQECVNIYGDSKLVVCQMNSEWKLNKGQYIPFAVKAKQLAKQFKNLSFTWVPRDKNVYADNLSKKELIKHSIQITKR